MKAAAQILLWCLAVWAALLVASAYYWPFKPAHAWPGAGFNDYPHTLFVSTAQETVYELGRNCPLPPRHRLIILGGSGARAFLPPRLQAAAPGGEVLNLALTYSNFTMIRQVATDLRSCLGAQGLRDADFVLVPSLYSFVDTATRFPGGYTAYEAEKLRHRLYAGAAGAVAPVMKPEHLSGAIELWRPVLMVRKLSFKLQENLELGAVRLRHLVFHEAAPPENGPEIAGPEQFFREGQRLLPDPDGQHAFAPEQAAELRQLVAELRASGAHVIVAEQPIQRWLRERSLSYPVAHALVAQIARTDADGYIDLTESADESEFQNAVHANAAGMKIWSDRLADALPLFLRKAPPKPAP